MSKDQICIKVYTYKNISDVTWAKKLVMTFSDAGLYWDKIGDKEPLRETYTDELFLQFWDSKKTAGFQNESLTEYANVFCSLHRGKIKLDAGWKNSNPGKYSSVVLYVSRKAFCDNSDRFFALFHHLVDTLDADYACICNMNFWFKIRGTYFAKIPIFQDVHWVTFFSHSRMQMMKGSIKELEWATSTELPQGTVCLICNNVPRDGDSIEERCLEYRAFLWNV